MIYLFDIPCLCEQWNFPLLGTIPEAPGPPLERSGSVTRVKAGTFGSDASGHRFRQQVPKVARRVVKLCTGGPSKVCFTVFFFVAEGDTSAGLTGSLVSSRPGSSSVIV